MTCSFSVSGFGYQVVGMPPSGYDQSFIMEYHIWVLYIFFCLNHGFYLLSTVEFCPEAWPQTFKSSQTAAGPRGLPISVVWKARTHRVQRVIHIQQQCIDGSHAFQMPTQKRFESGWCLVFGLLQVLKTATLQHRNFQCDFLYLQLTNWRWSKMDLKGPWRLHLCDIVPSKCSWGQSWGPRRTMSNIPLKNKQSWESCRYHCCYPN